MPTIIHLQRACSARLVTFPMCAFGAPWQKHTSLMFSAGFEPYLSSLSTLTCKHTKHDEPAGGRNAKGIWSSHRTAAYPPNFNYYLAKAVLSLCSVVATSAVPTSLAPQADTVIENDVISRAKDVGIHPMNALLPPSSKPTVPVPLIGHRPPGLGLLPGEKSIQLPVANAPNDATRRELDFNQAAAESGDAPTTLLEQKKEE